MNPNLAANVSVPLTLTGREAAFLAALAYHFGGSPESSTRGIFDGIRAKLGQACPALRDVSYSRPFKIIEGSGSLYGVNIAPPPPPPPTPAVNWGPNYNPC